MILRVPVGTLVEKVREDGTRELLGDLVEAGQRVIVARGGKGGWGNARFARPERRAPRIAQRGQPGERAKIGLNVKLIADVGIVGLPNVGKSALLARISAARPKVAAYPFTTVEPVLGVVGMGLERIVVVDIPGLIEGAHRGAGMGLEFLRHVERTAVILHLLDGTREDVVADLQTVNDELSRYSGELGQKRQAVAVNKVDLPEVRARIGELSRQLMSVGIEPLFVSALTGEGTGELIERLVVAVSEERAVRAVSEPLVRPREVRGVRVLREDGAFRVEGEDVVAFAEMMPLEMEEGREELWRRLRRWGVVGALRRAGAKPGDIVRLGRVELEWPG